MGQLPFKIWLINWRYDKAASQAFPVGTGFKASRKNLIAIKPKLVAEIQYGGWTHDEKLRHPSYKELREEKDGHGTRARPSRQESLSAKPTQN